MSGLFFPLKRTTLHILNTGPASDAGRGHLFIVLNDPCTNGLNLLVPLNSTYPKCDKTCLINGGHKFVTRESFAAYNHADTVETAVLIAAVKKGAITYEGLFDEAPVEAMRNGILLSPHTRPRVKQYYTDFCVS